MTEPVRILGISGSSRAQLTQAEAILIVSPEYNYSIPGPLKNAIDRPEVFVAKASDKFDAEGKLHDEGTRKVVADLLVALRDFTLRLRKR